MLALITFSSIWWSWLTLNELMTSSRRILAVWRFGPSRPSSTRLVHRKGSPIPIDGINISQIEHQGNLN